jgi:hypothetical protein
LQAQGEFAGAELFTDDDALGALDRITHQRPKLVVLERSFADTSRGGALITRIKADPALAACEIRVVTADGAAAAPPAPGAPLAFAGAGETAAGALLDQRGTRRAPRFKIVAGIDVVIDGNPATLIDLSLVGAHVLSPTILRPNQRVRLSLPDPVRAIRVSAGIAWAAFEMPKAGPRYRAGIEFFDADAARVGRFLATHKVPD